MFEGMFTEENRKKIIITSVILLIIVIFVFYILPLFFSGDSSKVLPSEIVLNEEELQLNTGESYLFIPDLYPSDVTEKEIKWSSSNSNVVSVNEEGMIEAIRPGTAIITATTKNKLTDFTIVEVTIGNDTISDLSLNMEDISLKVGTKKKFEVILEPADTQYESIEWEVDNNKVVTIDQNGEVYGLATGTAVITAKVRIDSLTVLSVSSNVHVVKETTLFANKSSSLKQLYPYKELELSVRISDNTIQISNLEVYSANNNIAKLVEGPKLENNEMIVFKVRAMAPGSTNIIVKASTKDGENLQLSLPVEVKAFTSVSLDKSSVSLYEGEQTIINAKVSPAVGVTMLPICATSDSSVATVFITYANKDSYNGACLIKGLKKGKATISVTLAGKKKSITVYVNSSTIETTKITLNHTSETVPVGQTLTLKATVLPTNATDKTVTWTSSDTDIATVSNGIVATHKPGKVTITAKTTGGQTAKATITVTETDASISGNNIPVESLSIDPSSALLNVGESITLRTTFYPADATDKTVTWTSSNPNVATVNNGVVTAKAISNSQETVTITAKSGNNKVATATIYILKSADQIAPTGVKISEETITIEVGEKKTLTATVIPSNATNKTITWASGNTEVATASNGVITGVKEGQVAVVAVNSAGQSATVIVNVTKKQSSSSSGSSSGTSGGTSSGGSSSSKSEPPKITITKTSGTSGENGWYTSNVVLKVSVEAEAGLESLKYCVSADGATCNPTATISNGETITLSNQGKSLQVKVTAKDKKGTSTSKTTSSYKIDKTKPTCKITSSALSSGYRLTASGTDSESGFGGLKDWKTSSYGSLTPIARVINDGGTYTFYVKDKAGNTTSCSETFYKCGRARSCKTCTSGDCTKGCTTWNSWTDWLPWNERMYSVQTQTAYNQVEFDVFMNSDCSNG